LVEATTLRTATLSQLLTAVMLASELSLFYRLTVKDESDVKFFKMA